MSGNTMATTMAASPETTGTKRPLGMDWDAMRKRLLGKDMADALAAGKELKEGIEVVHTKEFPRVLSTLLPAFTSILVATTRPNPDVNSTEHCLRYTVLEIISRMPKNDILRPHAPTLLETSMSALNKDYEENALLASKIIFDLHKSYRPMPQDQVQPYLDFVQAVYRTLPTSVQRNFHMASQDLAAAAASSVPKAMDNPFASQESAATPSKSSGTMGAKSSHAESPSAGIPSTPTPKRPVKSTSSFRVLTECPLTVMLLFQLYPKFLKTNIPALIQLMMEALAMRPPQLQSIVGSGKKIESHHKRLYYTKSRELVAAQVKTLSFLTYLLRGFSDQMKPYEDRIATNVVSLMTSCPRESIGTRKELLVATRHILATDFRKGFFRHVDSLLDERILMGSHHRHSDQTIMRPLGYSTLADLVHHVRSMLTLKQLSRVVYMFSRVLHDSSMKLPMTIQITAVRLLLNVVDIIFHNKDSNPQVGRDLLDRILDTLVSKLGTISGCIDTVRTAALKEIDKGGNLAVDLEVVTDKDESTGPDTTKDLDKSVKEAGETSPTIAEPHKNTGKSPEKEAQKQETICADKWMLEGAKNVDSLQDIQSMVRSIIVGLKTVVWCITNYRLPKEKDKSRDQASQASLDDPKPVIRLTKFERDIVEKYINYAVPCMKLFVPLSPNSRGPTAGDIEAFKPSLSTVGEQQQRDVLTYFAACFTVLDGFNLHRTLGRKIRLLVDTSVDEPSVMVIPRHLLGASRRTSFEFCEMLIGHLVQHLDRLSVRAPSGFVFFSKDPNGEDYEDSEKKRKDGKAEMLEVEKMSPDDKDKQERTASTYLELFERVIKSMSAFPENEKCLRPFLQKVIASSLRLSMEKGNIWPDNYCLLLRSLFRSISAGKFEESYKEVLPMIPTILNGLYRIFQATEDQSLKCIVIELCLTIPARLSSLLPHMPLLLRMIIPSLKSNKEDLVNLGLRTLEFWIDNLNPEFLYPILAKQTKICTDLIMSLTSHLRPVPYPYGLLALRLLGKLGGKNRRFLRDAINLPTVHKKITLRVLSIECEWSLADSTILEKVLLEVDDIALQPKQDSEQSGRFSMSLPLASAVKVLKIVASIDIDFLRAQGEELEDEEYKPILKQVSREEIDMLWTESANNIDLSTYCCDVVERTVSDQASSALHVIYSSLASILDLDKLPPDLANIDDDLQPMEVTGEEANKPISRSSVEICQNTECLKDVVKGLLYGLSVDNIRQDASNCAKGLFFYFIGVLTSMPDSVIRIDANGSKLSDIGTLNAVGSTDETVRASNEAPTVEATPDDKKEPSNKLGSLRPFGYFALTGRFESSNPFVMCEALAEMISETSSTSQSRVVEFFERILRDTLTLLEPNVSEINIGTTNRAQLAFYESLLEALCRFAVSKPWNIVSGLRSAILIMVDLLGPAWAQQYEVELIHVAIASIKNAGQEIPFAGVKAFQFFVSISILMYGKPHDWDKRTFVPDVLAIDPSPVVKKASSDDDQKARSDCEGYFPSDTVLNLLIIELASTKQLVRFAARYALKSHVFERMTLATRESKLSSHMSTIKRVLFTRSLRLLPLPEQVAVIEALSTLVDFVPGLLPVADQHLLAFLSEYLKLSSIADGEMSDSSIVGYVVDKNGFTRKTTPSKYSHGTRHMSGIFLRRECVARLHGDKYILIPEELPLGVQLRVSALRLLNTVIRRHADGFFDADSTTPIGNIRPHVISLLFRSLVSEPPMSVCAAHIALQDVLSLSVVTNDDTDGRSRSQSRLPKELLQTCIRPVLLNLRDYTRLSVPLLRGLARLLSLLSGWFNKTLGEKLLEHLQKWAEPELVMACSIWKVGDEPTVAARILDLFALLPHASHFVEPLVKTVIKLETALHRFKGNQERSPYRKPLARYLNKQSQSSVSFFFQRLKNPMYNELFQDIVALKESETLRTYLSGRQCSVTLLNVCFERPLAIIRSEKTSASKSAGKQPPTASSAGEIMSMHGIVVDKGKQREALLRQDIDARQKKLVTLQQEVTRSKEVLQARLAPGAGTVDGKDLLEDAKRRHRSAQATFEKAQKELNESKQRYAAEIAHPETADSTSTKKMTVDALELQHQGFKLVETLVDFNENYLTDHNDIVRAFRWLWRSKGRHLRLQHEELMPPRFHKESKLLGLLLVKYSKAFPNDVDVLFELLRIFLQPTTCDFGFIRDFLAETVSTVLSIEKKRHVIQRFFALLAGEGPEETKVLSIQLIVMPMLVNTLSDRDGQVLDAATVAPKASDTGKEKTSSIVGNDLVTAETVKQFVEKVLLKNGSPALFGDRVRVELLRMSTLLIRCVPKLMDAHKKDVLKFSWGLLKSEDTSCKSWAYLNVCNFIASFETPARVVLQVYVSMIRLHQHEGKGYIRSGLSILLPSLSEKLDKKEFGKLIEYSTRIIYEEGNNIPQLVHIWQTIIAHSSIFVSHRAHFLKHMVNSLNRLGLPPNCPIENRALSLSIAELILEWYELPVLAEPIQAKHAGESPKKKMKGSEGQCVSVESGEVSAAQKGLDHSMVDTIANFVVRMKILLADTKAESCTKHLEKATNKLLAAVLEKWERCSIHPVYFEKVVSMCMEEVAANRNSTPEMPEKKSREKTKQRGSAKSASKNSKSSSSKGSSSHSTAGARDEPKPVSSTLLLACLQIFTALVTVAPSNSFLTDNAHVVKEILEPCFLRASRRDGKQVRKKLKEFLVPLLKSGFHKNRDSGIVLHVKVFLESFIISSLNSETISVGPDSLMGQDSSRRDDKRSQDQQPFPSDDGKFGGSCLAFFSLDIIREISTVSISFVQSFSGSLIALLEKLVNNHVHEVSPQRQNGPAAPAGRGSSLPYQQATPTSGILEEARMISATKDESMKWSKSGEKPIIVLKVSDIGTSLRSIVTCLELIALSDLPFCFNGNRQKFMKSLGSILDSSDNVQLLLAAVGIVGHWLVTEDSSGPLAFNERIIFLRKISCLDSRLKSPIVAQTLSDLVGFVVLTIAGQGFHRVLMQKSRISNTSLRGDLDSERSQQCFDTTHTLFQRCLVSCILNANLSIRHKALSLFGSTRSLTGAVASDTPGAVTSQCFQLRARPLFDMLWQLFHTDYEGVCKRMWTVVFVDVLLSGCSPESGKMEETSTWIPRPRRPAWNGLEGNAAQDSVKMFFDIMTKFTNSSNAEKGGRLADVLNLAHSDQLLIQTMFESLMVSAWKNIADDASRSRLIVPIEKLLSRPYHAPTLNHTTQVVNSVQSLLRACKRLDPQPVLDPNLLVSLAGSYRAWHEVTSILEQEYIVLSSSKNKFLSERVLSCIQHCMQQLGEENIALSIVQSRCTQPETGFALSLDVHGMVKEAISGYTKLIDLAESSENEAIFTPSDVEMDAWESRFVELHKEMCQLGVVVEYATSTENYPLLLEASWKNKDWDKVDALISSAPMIAMCERGDPTLKMTEILLAITRGKLSEVENLHAQTAQLCLQKWQLLPDVANGSHCHSDLLHFFHRLVEFRESGQIMVETMNHSNRRTLPDLKNLLSAWRHRLPNEYDRVSDWDDIITWRLHMFSSITSNFQWSEAGALSTLHDRPWTTIRMAKTARKQGLREVSMMSLNRISDGAMDVSDAFSKLREQILAFYNLDSDLERTGGLNLVNTTNLSFFDASQKSELFRLKAQFLSSLGGRSKANQAYCHAVQVCPSYARAWVSWGGLCSSLGRLAEKQQNEQQSDSGDKENPNAKKVAQYLAQAMGCYLEAVNCDTDEWCRIHLPKCLWMLAKDGSAPGVLSQTLESRGAALACWVWLPWCPQLLTSLYRNEGKAAKAILTTLAKTYPQALYFPLRAFYLERRDVERSKGSSSGPHQGSVLHSEELMSSLRRAHASLWSSLEAILEELIVKFRPSYEEELLATITALLDRAETQVESSLHTPKESSEDEEAVVASISKTLGRISTKFFRETPPETASSKRDERARKTEAFKEKYKALFEEDFLSLTAKVGEKENIHLSDFLMRLRKWKNMLEVQVSSTPRSLPLVESSQSLALFATEAPDLWPMSCDPKAGSALFESERTKEDKPNPSSTSASALAARTAAITAALAVAQSASSEGHGGEYGGGSSSIEIPGQYVPNSISAVDLKPSPELHAKLVRFESRVKVVRRNDQLIRRIGMVGSDGRTYDFLLQFAIPYWTRTDERTVQLCYLVDKILRRDVTCSRNFLSIQPAPVIPIAQRLRMTYETEGRLSLDDVFRRRCEEAGCETNVISTYYQSRVKKLLELRTVDNLGDAESKIMVATTNMEVLREICEKKVDRSVLLDHIQGNLVSSEGLFHFRRAFASQLAINSLMQHAFSVVLRTPSRVVINEASGQVFSPEFRFSYNNQGFLENQKVPFRMTPNLQEMVGPTMMRGRFVPSMAMTATAIKSKMEDIDAILRLLLRDDIVSWYTSKSMAKSDSKTQELEKQLADRVAKNVSLVQSKISECAVKMPTAIKTLPTMPVDQRVRDLLAEASSYEKLSTIESSFQPWL